MTNKVLGGGALDGNLGLNPDFSTLTIPLGRVVQSVDNEGYIQYWIIEETLKAGGNALSNGLYANSTTLKEVAGGVSKLSEQNRQAIEAVYKAQGYNNVFFFEDGFTYTEPNDVGIYEDGTAWVYNGVLPQEVSAGLVPSEPSFSVVTAKDSVVTLDEAINAAVEVGTTYLISDMAKAPYTRVNSSDTGGFYIAINNSTDKLKLVYENEVKLDWFNGNYADGMECGASTIYLPSAFTLDRNVNLPPNTSLIREGSQCVIDATSLSNNAIQQAGSVRTSTLLSVDASDNDSEIQLTSVAGLVVGDVLRIYSTTANSWSGTWGSANRDYRKQNIRIVTGISGSTISLDAPLNTPFLSNSTTVDCLNTTTASHKNFKIIGSETNNSRGFKIQYGYKNLLEKVETSGFAILGVEFEFSLDSMLFKSNSELLSPAINTQYTVAISSSRNTLIAGCDLRSSRHATAIVGAYQCENTTVENCILHGSYPADAHGNADGYQYINCDIHGDNGIKIGGRNGAWRNCRVTSKNGTVIGAFEVHSGRFFIGEGTTIKSLSTDTFGAGWSPVDLGRGTASISSDSRGDIEFDFNGAAFTLPNLTSFFVRVQNTSAYKVNFRVDNLNVDYPTMDSLIRYEGNPAGDDADYVIFGNNIYENSTNPSLEYFKRGTDATGYDSTPIVYPTRFGPKPRSDRKGFKFGDFGEVISDGNDATIASRGTASSANDVVLAANSRFGEIVFKTGFSGSAKEFTDVAKVSNTGDIVALVTGRGLIAKSPDGTEYRLTPNNGGGSASWVAV